MRGARELSADQLAVLDVLRSADTLLAPAEVASMMGEGRSPAGAGQTLASLHRHGLVARSYADRGPVYRLTAEGWK